MKEITPLQFDLLKEMGSIGVGHATQGIAQLLGERVQLVPPQVHYLPFEKIADFLGGAEQTVSGVYLKILGEVDGAAIMVLPEKSALKLGQQLLKNNHIRDESSDIYQESALQELTNIAVGSYLVALSDLTGLTMLCSVPSLANDMLGSMLNDLLIVAAKEDDHAVLLDTEFLIEKESIKGYFLLIFEPESMEKIFMKLKVR